MPKGFVCLMNTVRTMVALPLTQCTQLYWCRLYKKRRFAESFHTPTATPLAVLKDVCSKECSSFAIPHQLGGLCQCQNYHCPHRMSIHQSMSQSIHFYLKRAMKGLLEAQSQRNQLVTPEEAQSNKWKKPWADSGGLQSALTSWKRWTGNRENLVIEIL